MEALGRVELAFSKFVAWDPSGERQGQRVDLGAGVQPASKPSEGFILALNDPRRVVTCVGYDPTLSTLKEWRPAS